MEHPGTPWKNPRTLPEQTKKTKKKLKQESPMGILTGLSDPPSPPPR